MSLLKRPLAAVLAWASLIRVLFLLTALAVTAAGYVLFPWVTADPARLDLLAYWGTVATIIGLLLTLMEVLHGLREARSVQEQSLALLRDVQRVEQASTVSDCLGVMDALILDANEERYAACLVHFQHFRRLYVKMPAFASLPTGQDDMPPGLESCLHPLGEIELELMSAARLTGSAYLKKSQKHHLLQRLLLLKQELEARNPARRSH